MDRFLALMGELEDQPGLKGYLMGNWHTANWEWNFENQRYFLGPEESKTRQIRLLSRGGEEN